MAIFLTRRPRADNMPRIYLAEDDIGRDAVMLVSETGRRVAVTGPDVEELFRVLCASPDLVERMLKHLADAIGTSERPAEVPNICDAA